MGVVRFYDIELTASSYFQRFFGGDDGNRTFSQERGMTSWSMSAASSSTPPKCINISQYLPRVFSNDATIPLAARLAVHVPSYCLHRDVLFSEVDCRASYTTHSDATDLPFPFWDRRMPNVEWFVAHRVGRFPKSAAWDRCTLHCGQPQPPPTPPKNAPASFTLWLATSVSHSQHHYSTIIL
jgi:hypothetical protein